MKIIPRDFAYNTSLVTRRYFDEHLKLYKGYVDKVNQIREELVRGPDKKDANAAYSYFRGLKTGVTFCVDGVILHELFFQNITNKKTEPGPCARKLMEEFFGSYENWADDLAASAKAARGWVLFSYEQRTGSCVNIVQDAHDSGVVCMAYPLLALDMYEHAYFGDYGTDKERYITKFLESVNWDAVEGRARKLQGGAAGEL